MNNISNSQMILRHNIHSLWRNTFHWIMTYIVNVICNFGNISYIAQRINKSVDDLAKIINNFYGYQNAKIFELLFKNHFLIATKLVRDVHDNDIEMANEDKIELYQNEEEIADFLANLNPYWTVEEWRKILYSHLELLEEHMQCMYLSQSEAYIKINEVVEKDSFNMADYMVNGIIKQFNL